MKHFTTVTFVTTEIDIDIEKEIELEIEIEIDSPPTPSGGAHLNQWFYGMWGNGDLLHVCALN